MRRTIPVSLRRRPAPNPHRPRQLLVYWLLSSTLLFSVGYLGYLTHVQLGMVSLTPVTLGLLLFKTAVELGVSWYGFTFVYSAIAYWRLRESPPPGALASAPAVGIVYLCCHDLDREALASLAGLTSPGPLYLIVHDDADTPQAHAEVDTAVAALRSHSRGEVLLLRRSTRDGGKAGAVNYVLRHTGHLYDYFLLCDNDTRALDAQTLPKALAYCTDDQVAIMQGRSVPVIPSDCSPVNRVLSQSIAAFHLFLSIYARFGWLPFVGHNALLRTRAVQDVGGFTPGFFSDDLDLTVRLNLRGWTVRYAPEVRLGETHPPSYTAFRKRTYKWAYGCVQTLQAHAWAVLTTPQLSLAEKVAFFQFAGFYVGQTLLLPYLAITFGVLPFYFEATPIAPLPGVLVGSLIIAIIFLPILTYFAKARQVTLGLQSALLCSVVYGAMDFCCARGVWDGLWHRQRPWIPTNQRTQEPSQHAVVAEALFGLLLLGIPLVTLPAFLYLPCTYLFVGKFLFGPALALLYNDHAPIRLVHSAQVGRVLSGAPVVGVGGISALVMLHELVGPTPLQGARAIPGLLVTLLVLAAGGTWCWARGRRRANVSPALGNRRESR